MDEIMDEIKPRTWLHFNLPYQNNPDWHKMFHYRFSGIWTGWIRDSGFVEEEKRGAEKKESFHISYFLTFSNIHNYYLPTYK